MNIYNARWNNALRWANKVKSYYDNGDYILENLEWGVRCTLHDYDFVIEEVNKTISINTKDGYSVQTIYEYNLDYDHGSYTTIEDMNKVFAEFKLYSMVEVTL